MEPQNKNKRRKVFLRFLALFIIGILLVTIPLYFTIRLPQQENKLTSEELHTLQEQVIFQRDYFAARMDSVKNLLDSYDSKDVDIDMLNADIGFLLSEMEKSFAEDTSWRKYMYENIVQSYLGIKKTKNSLIDVNEELSNCENNLKTAQSKPQKPKTTVVK
ncbi:MAG: hypothetical protein KAK04_15295 [Cyclobacteriaceae bacterium]|nr:hypothetical protein [Cyclobacteriaceae bacterium]